jgi:hypothetical protein
LHFLNIIFSKINIIFLFFNKEKNAKLKKKNYIY